jgi:hypothetical protein
VVQRVVTLANESHKVVDGTVQVTGIPELMRALREMEPDTYKELRASLKQVADHVVGKAQQRMPFGPPSLHAMQSALKPSATSQGARITFPAGGADSRDDPLGYYPWLDFGGTVGRGRVSAGFTIDKRGRAHSSHQVASREGGVIRPVVKGGRFLYPAIAESGPEIEKDVYAAVERAAHHNNLDTEGF